ncbi:MAG: substrate-binding domain-containing protein [Trueperaceae bacterium]|nr:substrate-binding domain-containing protein [Trueperaceae bacterium]
MRRLLLTITGTLLLAAAAAQSYTIGISNGFVGSEWRTLMVQDLERTAAAIKSEQGIDVTLVFENADVDVQGQIQQIQNLLNKGVDAIIVNPNDQQALNLALEEAVDEGVVVIAIDQEVSAQGAYNVVIDQREWGATNARWLAEALGGKGNIVIIEGFVGHPANEDRMAGVMDVLSGYPDIKIVGRESGGWDQATGQRVASDMLASLPGIDGILTQDGMAQGILTAVRAANPTPFPIMTGEAYAGYLRLWDETSKEHPGFSSVAVVNPPGIASSGLRVALELLQGRKVDESQLGGTFGNTLYVPIPFVITQDGLAAALAEYADKPDSYAMDGIITQEDAAAFMQ